MRYRCISVLEEFICTQDYIPFERETRAWGLPVKMLKFLLQDQKLVVPWTLWTPIARTLNGDANGAVHVAPGRCPNSTYT